MSENLKKYNEIRDFKKTKEPVGKKIRKKDFRFCVQHHIATHDHYDFRLEYDGVLISFAVPKGPSYNPKDKRLAIKVENHPVSYINFEGVIEKGQYGAGVVMLFDIGKYKEIEKFKDTLNKGYLKFELFGSRLKGKWTLVRFKDNNWLLIKDNDNVKLYDDINEFNTSIKSNKKIEDLKDNIKITHPDKVIYESTKTTKKAITSTITGAFYATTDELHQFFMDGRSASIIDIGIDTLGVITGVWLFLCLLKLISIIRKKEK